MNTIKLNYWAGYQNFGDELSPYLIRKITGKPVTHANQKELNKLIALGSIIDFNNIYSRSHIWGSGLLASDFINPRRLLPLNKIFRKKYFRSKIHATRGLLSQTILKNLGFPCPDVYGDPGILTPYFYSPKSKKANFKFGLIFHQTHKEIIKKNIELLICENIRLISIDREGDLEVEDFIDEVCACDFIFSTSLHGIIIAQVYEIPFQWLKIDNAIIHRDEDFKFKDYFSGIGSIPQNPFTIKEINESTLTSLKNFNFQNNKTKINFSPLLDAFPKEFLD